MSTLNLEPSVARVLNLRVSDDALALDLADGRVISAPLVWYPRLLHGNALERGRWEIIGDGEGVHWPLLDEDLSVESILAGRRSAEGTRSLQQWLTAREVKVSAEV